MAKKATPAADEDAQGVDLEAARSRKRRLSAAVRAGLTEPEAELFADSDTTMKTLRHCLTKGATAEQIAKIVV